MSEEDLRTELVRQAQLLAVGDIPSMGVADAKEELSSNVTQEPGHAGTE
jgi:hypothetical protein